MLLVFENWKKFQERLNIGERRFKKKANALFSGVKASEVDPRGIVPKSQINVWAIPRTFCVDCARVLPCFTNSCQVITEPLPHLDLEPCDVIVYWICEQCNKDEHMGAKLITLDDDSDETDTRFARREANILAYVQQARMAGDRPAVFNSEIKRIDNDGR